MDQRTSETPEEFELRELLFAFEQRYGMSSGDFLLGYGSRDLAPNPHFQEWYRLCLQAQSRGIPLSGW